MEDLEFQTVTLAGLIHDIGKFYARSNEVQSLLRDAGHPRSHPLISTLFIKEDFLTQLENIGINPDLLRKLVQHHHEDTRFPSECIVQSLSGREMILALIVSRADNYSSTERSEDVRQRKGGYEDVLLDSIFQRIDTGEGCSTANLKIRPQDFKPENIFPEEVGTGYWGNLVKKFGNEIRKLKADDFDTLFVTLMHLIQKYCWSTPSDITREVTDISLSDHLKTTSAIAACLYKYHKETNSFNESAIKDEQIEKFMLIGGDLSGIQRYIYDIAEVGVGGAAKRLRARSFKLSLLSEVTAHYIIDKLHLPLSCLLFSAGGRFCILAPADNKSRERFSEAKEFIETWFLKEFHGELALNLVSLPFSAKYFSSTPVDGSFAENFRTLWVKFGETIEEAKLAKFIKALQDKDTWKNQFLAETEFEDDPQGVCRVCRKFPAVFKEEEYKVCRHCRSDRELGEKLLKGDYLAFYKESDSRDLSFFDMFSIGIYRKADEIEAKPYIVYSLNKPEILPGFPSGFKFIANYVPTFKNEEELENACAVCSFAQGCDFKGEIRTFPHLYTFQCIASFAEGAKHIAALKVDVDNLGFIINKIPEFSISRMTTFVSFLDAFFSGYLPKFLEEKFSQTYVVYSGGDDLLLVGPWDKVILLSKEIKEKFSYFTCKNPSIHLSSGIALGKAKFPMANLAKFVTELLDEAKDKGRNSLSVLSSVFSWCVFDNLMEFGELLLDSIRKDYVSSAFVYRLLTYQELYNSYKNGMTEGLIYLSRLAYDIERNLYTSRGEPKSEKLLSELTKLFDYNGEGGMVLENLKFPVSFALLKERSD